MRIRVYETGKLDLGTVAEMLCQTDRQTNFDPASRWIAYNTETTSSNTVKIMTLHGAKGLEFPIVIMTGLGFMSETSSTENNILFDKNTQQLEVKISKNIQMFHGQNFAQIQITPPNVPRPLGYFSQFPNFLFFPPNVPRPKFWQTAKQNSPNVSRRKF